MFSSVDRFGFYLPINTVVFAKYRKHVKAFMWTLAVAGEKVATNHSRQVELLINVFNYHLYGFIISGLTVCGKDD